MSDPWTGRVRHTPRRRPKAAALVAIVVISLAGCSPGPPLATPSTDPATPTPAATGSTATGAGYSTNSLLGFAR